MGTARRKEHTRTDVGKLLSRSIAALVLVGQALAVAPAYAQTPASADFQAADEQEIVVGGVTVGRHYRQAGGDTGLGYDVREPFFSALQAFGGVNAAGYPVSQPFRGVDGCTYQDFQVLLLQQCGDGPVQRANTFQILEEAGVDDRLQQLGIGKGEVDASTSFQEAVQIRLGWLEDPAIRERYLSECGNGSAEQAIQACGLPMNHPANFGPFVSQRFQRIAFQRWLVDGPAGIRAGDIARILGGDLLKETSVLTGEVIQPHAAGQVAATLPTVSFQRTALGPQPSPTPTVQPGATPTPQASATPQGTATPAPTPTIAPRTQALNYGFQGDFFRTSLRPQSISLIKNAGFGWAKQQVPWDQYEISQADCNANRANCVEAAVTGPIRYFKKDQLGFLDAVVDELSGSGLKVLLSVVRAPSFHAAPGGHTPADPNTLRDFLQFITARYKGKVQAIETWNEQNLSWEWGGGRLWPNAPAAPPQGVVDFVQLQKAAFAGVKAADASVIVVLPALTPTASASAG